MTNKHVPAEHPGSAFERHLRTVLSIALLSLLGTPLLAAEVAAASDSPTRQLSWFGDFRWRFESDFASRRADGSARDDRARFRIRARFGLRYQPTDSVLFQVRARTGSSDSHQSPHITIVDPTGDGTDDFDGGLDQWFVRLDRNGYWGWLGRNDYPFWTQNEFLWDDDATLVGGAVGWGRELARGRVAATAGYFALPVGLERFSGAFRGVQALRSRRFPEVELTTAVTLYQLVADEDDSDALVPLMANGLRDYSIAAASVRARSVRATRTRALGLDLFLNTESYRENAPEPFTVARRDQTSGYVLSAALGDMKRGDDWQLAYHYAHVEGLALNSSYTQDDWVRWGSATETRATNLAGHEIRFAHVVLRSRRARASESTGPSFYAEARLFVADAIVGPEDGNRFRIDLNARF